MGNKIRDCELLIELLGANLWAVLKLSSLVSHIITSLAQRSKVDLGLISKCVVSLSSKLDHASTYHLRCYSKMPSLRFIFDLDS